MSTHLIAAHPGLVPPGARGATTLHLGEAVSLAGTPGLGVVPGPVVLLDQALQALGPLVAAVAAGKVPMGLGVGAEAVLVVDDGTLTVGEGSAYVVRASFSGARVAVLGSGGRVGVDGR